MLQIVDNGHGIAVRATKGHTDRSEKTFPCSASDTQRPSFDNSKTSSRWRRTAFAAKPSRASATALISKS